MGDEIEISKSFNVKKERKKDCDGSSEMFIYFCSNISSVGLISMTARSTVLTHNEGELVALALKSISFLVLPLQRATF